MHIQTHQRTRQDVALTFPHQILVGRAKKMSGIGLGVMKYMYFGPKIGLYTKWRYIKDQILVTKTTEILLPPLARGQANLHPPLAEGQANLHPPLAKGQAKLCQVLTNTNGLVGSLNGLEGSPNDLVGSSNGMLRSPYGIPHICHFLYTGKIFQAKILHPKARKLRQIRFRDKIA